MAESGIASGKGFQIAVSDQGATADPRPVVSVTIGRHQVLLSHRDFTHVHVVPFADHALVVAALTKTLTAFTARQPADGPCG